MSEVGGIAYVTKRGGGVKIQDHYVVRARKLLADMPKLAEIRARQRQRILASLAERTGLPFGLAIVNIESWRETEEDPEPTENWRRAPSERSVLLVTTCVVRAVEYPEVRDDGTGDAVGDA